MVEEFAFDNAEERRKHRQNGTGWVEVIVGSMFSGKSEELIRRLNRAAIARQKVQVFKPIIDSRYSIEEIASHSGRKHRSKPVTTAAELLDAAQRRTALFRRMAKLFEEIDVLATPTISAPPPATTKSAPRSSPPKSPSTSTAEAATTRSPAAPATWPPISPPTCCCAWYRPSSLPVRWRR